MNRAIAALLLVSLSAVAACGSRAATERSTRSAGTSDFITQAEIEATPVGNAYDLVSRLRPRWLQQGNRTGSIGGGAVRQQIVAVYLDDVRIGSIEALRSLSLGGFRSLRWYDATRAAAVLRDVPREPIAGAIVISTKTSP